MGSRNHITVGTPGYGLKCKGCRRPIVYGERCETCKRTLRQRQRRKLKR
jgi:cellulose synthase/poly-beta-1,6-N-acetylglucosamine synthase-like glycosyltransferase